MACDGSRQLRMHQEATHASNVFGERAPRAWRYVSQSGTMTDVKEGSGQASPEERRASGIFVGRERELAELLAGVDEALEGRGRLFLVAGEPGIGKSRLTDELAAQARHRGVRVLYGRCWEAGGAPTYWPWVQALRAYVRDQPPDALRGQLGAGAAELAQILPEVRELLGDVSPTTALDAEGARFRLFDATATFLRRASVERPLLIVLDDLNVADTPSLLLLQFVAGELSETQILLVCAYRDVDAGPADPLAATVRELARHGVTRRLHLRGLSEPDVARLIEIASVIAREFGLDALERFSGAPREQLLETLDEAIEARVVAEVPAALGRFRFSHALIRQTLYDALSTARRIRLHRELGEVLVKLYAGDHEPHLAELAHHFFEAAPGGDVGSAIEYGRRAGDRALALYGYEDAARLYRMALEARDFREPSDDPARCDLLLSLGEALARAGEDAAAKTRFLAAAEIARRLRLPDQLARAAVGYGGRFLWLRAGDDPHVVPLLEDALDALPAGDSPIRVRLMARLACARRSEPDREPGAALSEQALAMARRLGDLRTLAYALDAYYGAHWWYDNARDRLELTAELARVARESQDREHIASAHVALMAALLELGRIGEAEAMLPELGRVADEIRQPSQQWMAAAERALLALFRGDFAEAEALSGEELQIGEQAFPAEAEVAFRAHDYWLRKEQGRFEGLETALRRAAEELWWYPMLRCFLAELYAELDRRADARRVFDELVANDFEGLLPRDNEWLVGATVAADVCAYLGDVDCARKLYDELLPFADLNVIGMAECARGSVARSLGVLATLLARHNEAEEHFQAALGANERMGARPWVARTQHEYAQLLLERDAPGDREQARELLGAALETARALGMATLAARIENAGGQAPSAPRPARAVFRREGEYWSIVYEGDAFRLRDSKGLRYLARLLAAPGEELHALELVGTDTVGVRKPAVGDGLEVGGFGDAGELLDAQAKAAYRQRLEELGDEIEEAEAWNDPERAARAREEREFIARELSAAVGLGGRDRRAASAAERARVNVTRAIKSALARIEAQSPALGAHLQRTIRTGTFCSYRPDPRLPIAWQL